MTSCKRCFGQFMFSLSGNIARLELIATFYLQVDYYISSEQDLFKQVSLLIATVCFALLSAFFVYSNRNQNPDLKISFAVVFFLTNFFLTFFSCILLFSRFWTCFFGNVAVSIISTPIMMSTFLLKDWNREVELEHEDSF